jgi:hypothetical protein
MIFADADGSNLIDICREATGRTYPDGYGHAIIYCDKAANATIELMEAACEIVAYAYSKSGRKARAYHDSDIARFTTAMAELPYSGNINGYRDANGKRVAPAPGRTVQLLRNGKTADGWEMVEYPATYGWLVEGVQLVLSGAMGNYTRAIATKCAAAMAAAGHPGY